MKFISCIMNTSISIIYYINCTSVKMFWNKMQKNPNVVSHVCNLSSWEGKAGRPCLFSITYLVGGQVEKGTCHQADGPEFVLWNPWDGRRELTVTSYPLTSTCVLWYVNHARRGILLEEGGGGRKHRKQQLWKFTSKEPRSTHTI